MGVIFNERHAADGRAHGRRGLPRRRLPDRLRLRGRDAARPPRPLPPAGLHHRLHRRRDRDAGADGGRRRPGALGLRRPAHQVRRDRDGARRPAATCPRCCSATSTRRARWSAASRSPVWPRSCPTRAPARPRSSRGSTRRPPPTGRPTTEVNVAHLAWDIMVGLGTLLFLLTLWWWASWIFRRDMPRSRWFLRAAAAAGVLSVITLEAGWTVSEVGRQPWIVYEKMKVEDAATANTGIWITFIGVVILYVGLGVTTILVLRGMSRRFREASRVRRGRRPLRPERAVERRPSARRRRSRWSADGHRRRRHPLRGDHHLRDLRRCRLRRRLLGPRRRRDQARRATSRGHRPLDRSRSGRPTTSG